MVININGSLFKTQKQLKEHVYALLIRIGKTTSVKDADLESYKFLLELCRRHPSADSKLKDIIDFQILQEIKCLSLAIVNSDYTMTSISLACCISGKSTPTRQLFNQVLRSIIYPQISIFKRGADKSVCKLCNISLLTNNVEIHIDHHEPQFHRIVSDFIQLNNIELPTDYISGGIMGEKFFNPEHQHIGDAFLKYHKDVAVLRVLCSKCNETRPH